MLWVNSTLRWLVYSSCVSLLPACGSEAVAPVADASVDPPWRSALGGLERTGVALWSFRFDAAPPDGTRLVVGIHLGAREPACARYEGRTDGVESEDYWFIAIDFNGTEAGNYEIVPDVPQSSATRRLARIVLFHRLRGAFAEHYPALSGSISIKESITAAHSKADVAALVSVHAKFPEHAVSWGTCRGGQSANGTVETETCSCIDDRGLRSTCAAAGRGGACCYDVQSGRLALDFDLAASPCPQMCRVVTGAPNYCIALSR